MLLGARKKQTRRAGVIVGRLALAGLALCLCVPPASAQAPAPALAVPASPGEVESAAESLYMHALAAKADARAAHGSAAARRAGNDLLRKLVADYPQSAVADDAALRVIEDGFCLTDAGYPDCTALAIRGYEAFLDAYPYSDRRTYVLKRLATNYLDLSFRFEQDQPWQSPEKSERCLGRALQLAELLAQGPEPEAAFGRELAAHIRSSGKAFSIIPGNLNNLPEE